MNGLNKRGIDTGRAKRRKNEEEKNRNQRISIIVECANVELLE